MLILGHQGAPRAFPPNSLDAFQGALDEGADGVELDARRTADRQLAVHHDPTLADGRTIVGTAASELPVRVATLGEALTVLEPARIVNIELKNLPFEPDFDDDLWLADAVVDLLRARDELDDGRIVVSSFHLPTIDRVRALAPALRTAWLVVGADDPAPLVDEVVEHGHGALHPHHLFVSEELVGLAHDAGLSVTTWTCNDPDRIAWFEEIGVDGLVTDLPAVARRALASGGPPGPVRPG